jgi:biopolymer transport protein ExbB
MYTILLSAGWPIWPLLALSIFGLAILMERTWYLRQGRIAPQTDLEVAFGLAEGMAVEKQPRRD